MRVAFLGSKGLPGRHGVEVVVEEVASRVAASGHQVTVYGYDWYMEGRKEWRGCRLQPVTPFGKGLLEMPSAVRKSVRHLLGEEDGTFDLVNIHSADPCLFAGPLYGRLPVAATSHGRGYRRTGIGRVRSAFSRIAEGSFLGRPDALSCVSPADTAYYNGKDPAAGVKYIPNGIPGELDRGRESDLAEWGLSPRGYVLFSAGRILPSKGLHVLLEAWRDLRVGLPLVVVGGPSGKGDYYREQVERSPEGVVFTGFIADERLWSLYRYPRATVFPSEAEAQSMTLLEFLGLGVETVYSDIPENTMVAAGLGHPFTTGSVESLRQVLSDLLAGRLPSGTDPAAGERLRTEHDWDRITDAYIELYRETMERFGTRRRRRF